MMWRTWRAAFEDLRGGDVLGELRHAVDRSRLWRVADGLDAARLHRLEEDGPLRLDDLVGAPEERAGRLLLGAYSEPGLRYALERYGLWTRLCDVGHGEIAVSVSGVGESIQSMTIRDAEGATLMGLKVRLLTGDPDGPGRLPISERPWLSIEWLCLQNPHETFAADRPALPGQEHPGLGAAREVMELLLIMGWRLGCAGLIGHPAWFHNAVMYRIHYRFVDPAEEGRMRALLSAWRGSQLSLAEFSQAVDEGRVCDESGRAVGWEPGWMAAPLHASGEFQDARWDDAVAASAAVRYRIGDAARASSSTHRS